jgi:hypothetical protein
MTPGPSGWSVEAGTNIAQSSAVRLGVWHKLTSRLRAVYAQPTAFWRGTRWGTLPLLHLFCLSLAHTSVRRIISAGLGLHGLGLHGQSGSPVGAGLRARPGL